jgi:hypothetical protein
LSRSADGVPVRIEAPGALLIRVPSAGGKLLCVTGAAARNKRAAATTLLKLLIEPNTPASVRARVADSIFNHAAKAIEDIEARLTELERQAEVAKAAVSR